MQLHQVRYFLAVAEHGGINAAAAALGLAQPTLSQAVRELERELGTELFHRIGRGMVLTSAGHALVGPAQRVLRDVVAAEGTVPDAAGHLRGRLDIQVPPTLAVEPLAGLVTEFRRRHPKVIIRIGDLRDEESIATLIHDGHCELAVCHLPLRKHDDLTTVELGSHEYWVAYPHGTDLPDADPLPLSDLPDIPFVIVPRGAPYVSTFESVIAESGKPIEPAAIVEHREARLPFVLAGVGGTFLERAAAQEAAGRGLVVRRTEPAVSLRYGLVCDETQLSQAGREFVSLAARQVTA